MKNKIELSTADLIIPKYEPVFDDILSHRHLHYKLAGGRGSTKSSFIGLCIVLLLVSNPDLHAVVFRKIGNTIKNSVYPQIEWAIDKLGLWDYFRFTKSPPTVTFLPTDQRILFFGLDDPGKIKSIKLPFGYIGVTWFEEYDQYSGEAEIRKVLQSTMRGGDTFWNFYSFNPPISINNWANEDILLNKDNTLTFKNTYLDVPASWLGQTFFEEAEELKSRNPLAYEHEYLGIPTGTGGNVFPNTKIKPITDEMIKGFDRVYMGIDWGWFPDPFHFAKMHYDTARMTLYIFDEFRANKLSNKFAWQSLHNRHAVKYDDLITADNAEPKSISDFRSYGSNTRAAQKGPDSVQYSMKWLQSLKAIVIDPKRCPETAKEFLKYEYEKDKNDKWISGYPDRDNHAIDAVRYAMERVWRRRGE